MPCACCRIATDLEKLRLSITAASKRDDQSDDRLEKVAARALPPTAADDYEWGAAPDEHAQPASPEWEPYEDYEQPTHATEEATTWEGTEPYGAAAPAPRASRVASAVDDTTVEDDGTPYATGGRAITTPSDTDEEGGFGAGPRWANQWDLPAGRGDPLRTPTPLHSATDDDVL